MSNSIEKNMTRAAEALGVSLEYSSELTDALKRREATQALYDSQPRDIATELAACPNPRRFGSLIAEVSAHNAIVATGKAAIRGGVHAAAIAGVEREFIAFVPGYLDQAHRAVNAALTAFTTAANECPFLDPARAVSGGYGDSLTAVHTHGARLIAHLEALAANGNSGAQKAGDRLAAIAVSTDGIKPLRMTKPQHRAQVSQTLLSRHEVANRDTARRAISDMQQSPLTTLHGIARNEYVGLSLNPSTGDDYPARRDEWRNADRTIRVESE